MARQEGDAKRESDTILIHTISSNFLEKTKLNYKRIKPPKHNYDKYLTGRSYKIFKSGIRSKETLRLYKKGLFYFCNYLQMTTEELLSTFNPVVNLNNNNYLPNVAGLRDLQRIIEDYVLRLQTWVDEGKIKAATCGNYLPPIKLFCEMNDIILNWKKIHRLLPRSDGNAADESYDRHMIQKMLHHCDLRSKIPILFMASSGMRLGAFAGLRDGHVTPIYNKDSKLIAAHVVAYKGTNDEYDTFITPEAYNAYSEYKNLRTNYGERINKESPLILRRFNVNKNKSASIDNKPVSYMTIVGLLKAVAHKAEVRTPSEHYNDRYNIKIAHGFRKFFNTTLRSIKTKYGQPAIQYIHKEWMMGHALRDVHAMEENYDRSDRVKTLLEDYLLAVPELTISDEERLKVEVKNLKTDISNMKSVSAELQDKDKQISELIRKQEEMEKKFQMIFSKIDGKKLG